MHCVSAVFFCHFGLSLVSSKFCETTKIKTEEQSLSLVSSKKKTGDTQCLDTETKKSKQNWNKKIKTEERSLCHFGLSLVSSIFALLFWFFCFTKLTLGNERKHMNRCIFVFLFYMNNCIFVCLLTNSLSLSLPLSLTHKHKHTKKQTNKNTTIHVVVYMNSCKFVCLFLCMFVFVCVRERERGRERVCEFVCAWL